MASCHLQTLIALTSFFFHFEFPLFYPLYSQIAVIGDFVSAVSHSLPLPLQKDPLVLAGKSDPVSYEVTVFFFMETLMCMRSCVCPSKVEFPFPLVLWNP